MSSIIVSFDQGRLVKDNEKVREDQLLNEEIEKFVTGMFLLITLTIL